METGSVSAIDDISLQQGSTKEQKDADTGAKAGVGGEDVDVDEPSEHSSKKKREKPMADGDVPETRIRNLSAVTVFVSLK